jgi:hypothetical protein
MPPWVTLLGVLTVSAVISLAVRYRRSGLVEREQMKWLLYACGLFAIGYLPGLVFIPGNSSPLLKNISNLLFLLSIPCIPTAITIAILRYHLFDIDVIIRQTLVFATLTGLLGLVYAGGIILLQTAFRSMTGQNSDLALVVTTLFIAALFTPLRQRVQEGIDRRFYRQKYNVDQALVEFAMTARSGTNLESLTSQCIDLIQRTLQPEQVSIWIQVKKPAASSPKNRQA